MRCHLTDALLHAAKGLDLGGEEAKEVEKYQALAEDAAGGELRVFKEGDDVDAVHWWVLGCEREGCGVVEGRRVAGGCGAVGHWVDAVRRWV